MSHHKNRPPNIEGTWLLTNRYSIIHGDPNHNPTLKDIQRLPDIDIILTQKKEFVVWTFVQQTALIPVLNNRLGVWKPTLIDGKIAGWELLLADYDDTNIGFIQVLKKDRHGVPQKLTIQLVESYDSATNQLQSQSVNTATMIRRR